MRLGPLPDCEGAAAALVSRNQTTPGRRWIDARSTDDALAAAGGTRTARRRRLGPVAMHPRAGAAKRRSRPPQSCRGTRLGAGLGSCRTSACERRRLLSPTSPKRGMPNGPGGSDYLACRGNPPELFRRRAPGFARQASLRHSPSGGGGSFLVVGPSSHLGCWPVPVGLLNMPDESFALNSSPRRSSYLPRRARTSR